MKVSELLAYCTRYKQPRFSTYRSWEITCRPIASREISSFLKRDAMDYEEEMARNLKKSTVRIRLGYLHSIWNIGIDRERIDTPNVWTGLSTNYKAPIGKQYPKLTYEDYAPFHTDPIFVGLWHHGMRAMELTGIRPEEIVLNEGRIPFFRLQNNCNRSMKNVDRLVPIHPEFLPYVEDFPFSDNKRSAWNWSRRLKKEVGVTSHALRHNFFRRMRKAKIDIALQGAIAGHKYNNAMIGWYGTPDLDDMLTAMLTMPFYE